MPPAARAWLPRAWCRTRRGRHGHLHVCNVSAVRLRSVATDVIVAYCNAPGPRAPALANCPPHSSTGNLPCRVMPQAFQTSRVIPLRPWSRHFAGAIRAAVDFLGLKAEWRVLVSKRGGIGSDSSAPTHHANDKGVQASRESTS